MIFRWQKARICNRNTPSLLGFLRCSFFAHYTPTSIVAVHTIYWSITWFVCGVWGYRGHLQTRRKRPSHGHIRFSTSFHLSEVWFNFFRPFFWDRLWLPLLAVKPIFSFVSCSYFLRVGLAAHYYSWRFMQQFLGLVGFLVFFIIIFFLPETSHPNKRGVDNLDRSRLPKWRPVILNPLQPLWLLRSPNLFAVVRILFSFCHFNLSLYYYFFGISLWQALRFFSPVLVCDLILSFEYTAHVFFSITGTARIYHCEFAQLIIPLSLSWRQLYLRVCVITSRTRP